MAEAQLRRFVGKLGKQVADPSHPGDLVLIVTNSDKGGLVVGPSDRELGTLRIYTGPNSGGRLLWGESYRGPADRPWPATVEALLSELELRMSPTKR